MSGPIVVCVINLKGGVGKSTICALLARHGYTRRALNVLAVDLDPQANLSQGLLRDRYATFLTSKEPSIVEIFNGYIPPSSKSPSPSPIPPEDIGMTIASIGDRSLQIIPSRFDFSDALLGAIRPDPRMLARYLTKHYKKKDIIFIDCSPTESVLTTAAYHASNQVLIPVKPEFFATIGFPLLSDSMGSFLKKNRSHSLEVCGVVVNNPFYDGGNDGGPEKSAAMASIKDDAKKNGWKIYRNQILHSRGYPKLMRGNSTHLGNAELFSRFANEFIDDIGL